MGDEFLDLDEPGKDGSGKDGKKDEDGKGEQLILGRFKTSDDLAKSYKELEAKFTQDSQEKSELKKQVAELQTKVAQATTPQKAEEPVDLDALYWDKPSKLREDLLEDVRKVLAPLYKTNLESQKAQYRSDPDFKKYEGEIDDMLKALPPQVTEQPGVVGELFNLVKGRHFGEILEDHKKRVREEIEAEREGRLYGSLEEPSGGETFTGKDGLPSLTEDEKRVALQFHSDVPQAEAFKRYATNKAKMEKVDRERARR